MPAIRAIVKTIAIYGSACYAQLEMKDNFSTVQVIAQAVVVLLDAG